MKLKKTLETVNSYFDLAEPLSKEQEKGLDKVLKKLNKKELSLQEKLATETDSMKLKHLKQALKVIHLQRKKGMQLLSTMRKENN